MMNQINSTKAVMTAVIFSISLLGIITKAEAHDGNTSATDVHACVKDSGGKTRIVSIDEDCSQNETAIHWAITGPAGADGATGPAGADGTNGTDGATGPAGAEGTNGTDGATGPAGTDGTNGTDGATGPAGADGTNGTDGATGPAGADGTNGTDGVDANQAQLDALQAQVDALQALVDELHPVFAIGDIGPAGGIVFHVTNDGLNGLEAAPMDQANAQWCSSNSDIAGVDNIGVATTPDSNSGAHNTPLIVAACAFSAAQVAANYVWPNGQTDGFLPNKEELFLLLIQRNVVGGFGSVNYWSSSENDSRLAWVQDFGFGRQSIIAKVISPRVRAVRAF